MGFFKNLFDKKVCDICGNEISLLGNRKLEDGNCCKDCAKKLSPWFTERKHSTVEEIKSQIESREANREEVASFHTTKTYGKSMMVYIDEDAQKFMVTDAKDLEKANPDVIDFSQVTACDTDIRESRNEVYRQVNNGEGGTKSESYTPRRFRYSYDFMLKITMNHPYIDEISADLSCGYLKIDSGSIGRVSPPSPEERRENDDYVRYEQWGREIRDILLSNKSKKADSFEAILEKFENADREYKNAIKSGDSEREFVAMNNRMTAMHEMDVASSADETGKLKFRVLEVMNRCNNNDTEKPAEPKAPETPEIPSVCPYCGSETRGTKFCENCGHRLI